MKRNIDDAIRPEVSSMASLAILVELLARLSATNSDLRLVTLTALKAAADGLQIVAKEHHGKDEKDVLIEAANTVREIRLSIFDQLEANKPGSKH
ncbi:hypothetical protein [Chelativorans sp. AA-79]|uniref:hypothetical protein n=1 Tax=Chelativorans sp. AA-79 TaxID=3028735 RepID=UPI0023F8012B|nr:hypothetical protein [Chelativorans sp. AA-79]WEX07852.1 hypothetical protein PVE73_17360 [Chelativorans sp. AA-79]